MRTEINRYVESIIAQKTAILSGDCRSADKYAHQTDVSICKIKQHIDWQNEFSKLLRHGNISVRVRSAKELLPYRPIIAHKVLFIASMSAGMSGFEAKMVLKQWHSKKLKFPELVGDEIVYR